MCWLLFGIFIVLYEIFVYFVCCVVVISFCNEIFIEEFRRFYEEMNLGSWKLLLWVDGEYLCYYVLIYDEENDDIMRFMGFFD